MIIGSSVGIVIGGAFVVFFIIQREKIRMWIVGLRGTSEVQDRIELIEV
jgi:hypothetical protein